MSISLVCLGVAFLSLYQMGYIVDELNLKGDRVSTYMVIVIGVLGILNPIIYSIQNKPR